MLLPWRAKKKRGTTRAGLQLDGAGVTLATVESDAAPRVAHIDCARGAWKSGIETLCTQLGIAKGTATVLILPPDAYSLLLVEPPEVPFAEIKEAVRWRIRELLSFPAEEAVLDVFPFPEDAQRGRRSVFVVAAHRPQLVQRIEAMADTRLALTSIDISELSVRNLTESVGDSAIAVLQVIDGIGTITLSKRDAIYMSRRIELKELDAQRTLDQALLQLQRSLDYFESQLGQGAASSVVVALPAANEAHWLARLQEMLPLPVRAMSEWLATNRALADIPSASAGALGGALRGAVASAGRAA